jgi:hypothetical protein
MLVAVYFCQTLVPVPCNVQAEPEHAAKPPYQLLPPPGALMESEIETGSDEEEEENRRPTYIVSVWVLPGVTPGEDVRTKVWLEVDEDGETTLSEVLAGLFGPSTQTKREEEKHNRDSENMERMVLTKLRNPRTRRYRDNRAYYQ